MIIGLFCSGRVRLRAALCGALGVAASGCGAAATGLQGAREVAPAVTAAGDSIYFGSVYPLEGGATQPSYVYERRVAAQSGELRSTHVTRTTDGAIAIAEVATHSPDYQLREYTLYTNQLGKRGSVRVRDSDVAFELQDGDEQRSASEPLTDPVLVGPTFVGYILRHLPELRAGAVLPVRLAVLDRLETLGFELQQEAAPEPGQTRIAASPSSFLISLAVDPLHFTFDTASGKLVHLEGRVPPKLWQDGDWQDFDARVEYRYVAAAYR
jgi:hypothetical protein